MGHKRQGPVKLGQKLKAIRTHLDLTQDQMVERLDRPSMRLNKGSISNYEKGIREPSNLVLLQYSKLANVTINVLVDDEVEMILK